MKPCRTCQREVSEDALACPSCGAPHPAKAKWDGYGYEYKSPVMIFGLPLTVLIGCLMLLASRVQAQSSVESNSVPAKIWVLTGIEKASGRLDLRLYCPWAAITNNTSWFFRSGSASEVRLSENDSRWQYLGSISTINIHPIQSDSPSNITFEVKWDGFSNGKNHRINTKFNIPVGQNMEGDIKYYIYDTPYPDPLSQGDVKYLHYEAYWTTKPR